jgi:two-component system nitrate/nitrite response regulator NarL
MARTVAFRDSGRMKQVRVLLVDDSVQFLDSASDFLSRDARVQVVGRARDGRDGMRLAEELAPDLVLMDLSMPVMNGVTATRRIKAWPTSPRIVIVTLGEHSEYRRGADDARADGYICKSHFTEAVSALIDSFFSGPAGSPLPPERPENRHRDFNGPTACGRLDDSIS